MRRPLPAWGRIAEAFRRPLIVLATGPFAIGTDAFVIGGVLPAVARSLGVSTGSAGLLVTAFAVAYALGAAAALAIRLWLPPRPVARARLTSPAPESGRAPVQLAHGS